MPSNYRVSSNIFWQVELFLMMLIVLTGDWNAALDPNIDCSGERLNTNNLDVKPFWDFIDRFDLVSKFRNECLWEVVWTWTNKGSSDLLLQSRYINYDLVKKVIVGLLGCSSLYEAKAFLSLCKLSLRWLASGNSWHWEQFSVFTNLKTCIDGGCH